MVCGAAGVGRFWMLFLANPRRLRAQPTSRGVIFPDRSPPERFLGSWLPRKGRGQRGWEPWSHFTRRAHSAHRPAREPPHSSSSAGIPPCLSTSWCVPRFSSRPQSAARQKPPAFRKNGGLFRVRSPEAPCGPGVSALPGPRRWPRSAATSPRDEIRERADRYPRFITHLARRRAEGSSPTSPTSGAIAATATTTGSRNTSTRCASRPSSNQSRRRPEPLTESNDSSRTRDRVD